MCRNLREQRFRETFPYIQIKNELLADNFHNRKKIHIDDMNILSFKAKLGHEVGKYISFFHKT